MMSSSMSSGSSAATAAALFGTAAAMQFGVGSALEFWPETASGGRPDEAYATVFGGLVALQAAAGLWCVIASQRKPSAP